MNASAESLSACAVRALFLLVSLIFCGSGHATGQQTRFPIAVTVDDAPWSGGQIPDDLDAATRQLLQQFSQRSIPAVGFVVCNAGVGRVSALRLWLEGGFELGNHTSAHRDLNSYDLGNWIDDVIRCDRFLDGIDDPRYFRYPMLHRGRVRAIADSARRAIESLGYQIAPVTVDNSEWIFAARYRDAPPEERQHIAPLYIAHMRRAVDHARRIARARFGREVSQILLLHANRLNVDWAGVLLDSLTADGARFISLEQALRDSIYQLRDDYQGAKGLSWLYRVAPEQSALVLWDDEEAAAIQDDISIAPPQLTGVAREIAARAAAFSRTYLDRRPADLLEFYTTDATLVLPGGERITGHEAIQRYWTLGPNRLAVEHRTRTESLYGDVNHITEVGRWFATSRQQGGEPVSASGRFVATWVRGADGQLRMAVDTWHR